VVLCYHSRLAQLHQPHHPVPLHGLIVHDLLILRKYSSRRGRQGRQRLRLTGTCEWQGANVADEQHVPPILCHKGLRVLRRKGTVIHLYTGDLWRGGLGVAVVMLVITPAFCSSLVVIGRVVLLPLLALIALLPFIDAFVKGTRVKKMPRHASHACVLEKRDCFQNTHTHTCAHIAQRWPIWLYSPSM
jgi:hypothetical protein